MNVPTAELHVHLEGTLEPELISKLAERNKLTLSSRDVAERRLRYLYHDLQSFLDLYYDNMAVLRTAADFADMTRACPHPAGRRPPRRGVHRSTSPHCPPRADLTSSRTGR